MSMPVVNEHHVAFYNNPPASKFYKRKTVIFQGMIIDEPDVRSDHIKYKIEAQNLIIHDQSKDIHGNVLVKSSLFPSYRYGDEVTVECALTTPQPIEDFKYDKYLANADIYSTCYQGKINLMASGQGNFFKESIYKIKARIVQISSQILPEPQSSFLGGLLWGAKRGLPAEILGNFNRTGVTHIIAVSGYNISIIAVMLSNLFISLGVPKKKSFWLIVLGIIFFVIITGSPASIVRAGIMGIVALMAASIGRAVTMHNTLAIVGVLMLLANPKVLVWDAGFQLSFLATIGLIYFVPVVERYTRWLPVFLGIRESLSTTISAIILTTPLILFQFGRFSFLSPVANLLILPIVPVNMAVGFLAVTLGLIWLPAGQIIGWLSWLCLTYVLKLTEILGNLPWAVLAVPGLSWIFMASGYVAIGYLIFIQSKNHPK